MGTAPTHSPEGVPQRSGIIEKKRVRVQNARLQHQLPTLDRNGFQCSGAPQPSVTSATRR